MTREEAILKINKLRYEYNDRYIDYCGVNEAVNIAIGALQAEPRNIDLQELEDRFGKYVRFVVEDMMSGEGRRWKNEHNY